jgi:acid phosphatase type 7
VFAPVADANIKSSSPAANYGLATTLRVLNSTEIYRTYLRFDVSGLTGNVSSAKLRLYVTDASPDGGHLFSVSNDWAETTITWTNAPPVVGGEIAVAGSVAVGTWVELDVTPLVTGGGAVSFGMTSLSTNSAIYGSRQSGTPPALVVVTGGTALPPPNASFTAAPTAGRAPLAVTFTDTSSGSPSSWAWDFQADGSIESTERNPVAVYRSPGTYSVRLTVGNATGTNSVTRAALVSVASGPTTDPLDPVFVGAGDIASCGSNGDELTAALLDGQSGTVYTLGDNVYESGTAAEYANCYQPSWGRHLSRTRPIAGNHEYNTPDAAPYYAYFGSAAGAPTEGWYSYDLGNWHVIALNSNCSFIGGCGAGSPMETWLRADLAAHASACTLAYWHHPLFSSGGHGNDPSMRVIWDVLDSAGTELVLSGHDHDYERFAPQRSSGIAATKGIREIVVGTGGKSLVGFKTLLANTETRSSTTYGVLRMILHGSGYTWEFLPATSGGFVDAGSDICH